MSDEKQLPVMRKALGDDWDKLADVVKQHYDITPGVPSKIIIRGVMDEVYHSTIAKLFLLPARIFGALVPYKGKNIPTEVRNWTSEEDYTAMYWHRTLDFPNKSPLVFCSRMQHVKGNEIIEYVRYGMGIRMAMSVNNSSLLFKSQGYLWKIGKLAIPIPTWALLGDAQIIEKAVEDNVFYISFNIVHPLFGRTFSYCGTFTLV